MGVSKEEVKHIAKLAHLGLSQEEIEKMSKELSLILDYFKMVKEVDTAKVDPVFYFIPVRNVTRDDNVQPSDQEVRNKMMGQAPQTKGERIKVGQILK